MKIFVTLVDSNAQTAAYKKALGITKDDIKQHLTNIGIYRKLSTIFYDIKLMFKEPEIDREKIKAKRLELDKILEEWKNGEV